MIFKYEMPGSQFQYEFVFDSSIGDGVDIRTRKRGCYGYNAWFHMIINGEIIWRDDKDNFLHLTSEVKSYLTKLIKLKAFW